MEVKWLNKGIIFDGDDKNEPPRFTTTLHSLWNHDFQNLIITPKEKDNPSQIIMHMYLITFLAHPHFLPFFQLAPFNNDFLTTA